MGNILVCDDERSICEMLEIWLRKEGHRVETVTSGDAGKKKIESALFDVVISDIRMPHTSGIDVLRYAHTVSPDTLVILITAVDDMEAAVEAVKAGGAFDYIRKGPGLIEDVQGRRKTGRGSAKPASAEFRVTARRRRTQLAR